MPAFFNILIKKAGSLLKAVPQFQKKIKYRHFCNFYTKTPVFINKLIYHTLNKKWQISPGCIT